jgi:Fe2+ or Zn2+ uptake regulation protein
MKVQSSKALAMEKAAKAAVKVTAQKLAVKQANRDARATLSDAELLAIILTMADTDRSSAFKVMTVLREQGYQSSRVRIRRVVASPEFAAATSADTKKARKNGKA